ncbi:hypothetical protein [Nonomuraea sp. CA-141351]|uniref:hypothetical protein n=1 Tax=Nonomuraea sp. CA-141351 TaxID=3239996 RepID=UPI003D8E1601
MRPTGEWTWAARGHRPAGLTILVTLLAGCVAGLLAAGSLIREIDAYHATHRQVTAEVVEERATVSRVTWDGGQHSGWARMPLDRVSGTAARVWLDDQGRLTPPPIGTAEVGLGALIAAVPAGAAGWLVVTVLLPWWVARRASVRVDREWRDYGSAP